jgi:hypothetical protein
MKLISRIRYSSDQQHKSIADRPYHLPIPTAAEPVLARNSAPHPSDTSYSEGVFVDEEAEN